MIFGFGHFGGSSLMSRVFVFSSIAGEMIL